MLCMERDGDVSGSHVMMFYTGTIMPPTSKKLEGHIASGLFVRPSVRPSFRPSVCPPVRHAF